MLILSIIIELMVLKQESKQISRPVLNKIDANNK